MKISTLTAPAESRFFSLPLELRMVIYELVLCPGTAINLTWQINTSRLSYQFRRAKRAKIMAETPAYNLIKTSGADCAFLRVCKMVQYEANEMFYSRNTFIIDAEILEYTQGFLDSIGERNTKLITRVDVTHSTSPRVPFIYWYPDYSSRTSQTGIRLKQFCERLPGLLELKMSDLGPRNPLGWGSRFCMNIMSGLIREIKSLDLTADKPSFKLLYRPDQRYVRLAADITGLRQTAQEINIEEFNTSNEFEALCTQLINSQHALHTQQGNRDINNRDFLGLG